MSFPRYPEYKDSGVAWLGDVPGHWGVDRLKASIVTSKNGIWGEEPKGDEDDTPCVRVADFDRQKLRVELTEPTIRNVTSREREGRTLNKGDLLLEKSGGGENQPVGCVVLYDDERPAVCSNFVARVQLKPGMVSSYWRYVHAAAYAVRLTTGSINQTSGIQNLDQDRYYNERAAFPPPEEQTAIATFLDRETAKIDALVAEQEKLIALLQEKRQAVISHAVTKGLDPTVPMKDSGVEWLGEVPAHWEVRPLKHVVQLRSGGTPEKSNRAYWDGEIPWASAKDLKVDDLFDTADHITQHALDDRAATLVSDGAVLVVVRGMILARTFPVVTARTPMAINQDLKAVLANEHLHQEFLPWLLKGTQAETLNRLDEAGHGTKALRMDAWSSMLIPVPQLVEQAAIANFLQLETRKLDVLTGEARTAVTLLQERRTAVISAAVTGQIDVRKT
jgi:type I restriction enzyme S subunit